MSHDQGLWRRLALCVLVLIVVGSMVLTACGNKAAPTNTGTAEFQLDALTISPAEALSGQTINISTTVRNIGSRDGTYTAELTINGHVVDTKDVTVASGDSEVVTFSTSKNEPGTYDVALGDRRGSFTISHPPLNVALDYIGVKYAGSDGTGHIRLLVLVDDGQQTGNVTMWVPLEAAPSLLMSDYSTTPINQTLFHTGSVGNYTKILIIAYTQKQDSPLTGLWGVIGTFVGSFFGVPELGGFLGNLKDKIDAQAPEYTYIGSYQATWTADQSWGIGRYDGVGMDDLRLWFRIWSDSPQQPSGTPTLIPDMVIQDVNVPALVAVGEDYSYTMTVMNNEAHPVTVTVAAHSSVAGDLLNQTLTVPADSTGQVSYQTHFEPAGVRTMTYTVLKDGNQVDTVSKTVEAMDRFDGWYVGGNKVTSASKSSTVTARFNAFDLPTGQYTLRIGRDIEFWFDEVVQTISFQYDGTPKTVELSFVPPYATGEASTRGYWVDLIGAKSLSFADSYPPRLIVTP
jgi:hypothetical protein